MSYMPERACIGCRRKKNKNDFIRIVKQEEKNIIIDKTGKLSGRGAYICKDIGCLEKAIKTNQLSKALKIKIQEDIYQQLRGVMIE